jgi:hypothetical protein
MLALSVGARATFADIDDVTLVPTIQVSAEQFAYDCQLTNDSGPGLRTVYVRHEFNIGATASRFKLSLGPGVSMTYVSETHPFPMTAGNTQDGISVCYGECTPGPLVLVTVTYMFIGATSQCSRLNVVPHPLAQTVDVIGCLGIPETAAASDMYVLAPGAICGCPDSHAFAGNPQTFGCLPVAVETTTWGAIKALYK